MKGQSVGLPVSWAVLSKNVGQLQSWRGHAGLLFGFWLATGAQCVQRTGSAGDDVCHWSLVDVYPVKWTGPTLDAGGNQVAVETLELAHGGFLKAG